MTWRVPPRNLTNETVKRHTLTSNNLLAFRVGYHAERKTIMNETLDKNTVLEIIAYVRKHYSEEFFCPVTPACPVSCYTAAGARNVCDILSLFVQNYKNSTDNSVANTKES